MDIQEALPSAVLIGNGVMGKRHKERLEARGIAFQAVCDSEAETLQFLQGESGSATPGLAVIAAPASTHASYVRLFLERGWAVFVEKPLATQGTEAKALCALAGQNQLPLFVGHSERYHPAFCGFPERFRRAFQKGEISRITTERQSPPSERGRDVSVTLDTLIHDLDLLFAIPGPDSALSGKLVSAESSGDSVRAELQFAHGLRARLHADRQARERHRSITAEGPDALLTVNLNDAKPKMSILPQKDALEREYDALLKTLSRPEEHTEALEAACWAVQMAEAIDTNGCPKASVCDPT